MTVAIVADNVPKNTSAKVAIASPSQAYGFNNTNHLTEYS
jgi:hypothetical protein